ncbi:conjugal transfer protein TraR [Caldicellulosiruptor changbaiensis]|uniref:Conjugal transfer protein TraR n=1 Tax=Caldicellulosiruptor changbaiensis TaxID=1222016 RepID=A0A3T0D5J9_9FIRM|nr:TraR/DksA C4-type zinc finger protein [Caldicellulosiruptor changbaiensis]AZT90339.1 conjugal transfer protein TraR [Caldicellulosiruptor changbaiensis]
MTHGELERFKTLLLQKKVKYEKMLQTSKDNQVGNFSSFYSNELSNYDNHPADMASDLYEAEKNLSMKASVERKLYLVNKALEKIKKGIYGICISCKKEIPLERLEAIPYTEFCIECEKKHEKTENYKTDARPIEEKAMGKPFNDKFISAGEEEHEGVDIWNILETHSSSNGPQDNMKTNSKGYYKRINEIDDMVEEVDRLSNRDSKKMFGE